MEKEMDYAAELYGIIDEFKVPCSSEEQGKFLVRCVLYFINIIFVIKFTLSSFRGICLN
jgi:hypothetical protein